MANVGPLEIGIILLIVFVGIKVLLKTKSSQNLKNNNFFSDIENQINCKSCDRRNAINDRFCQHCGYQLSQ